MATTSEDAARGAILEQERRALDRWAEGDPAGYFANFAEDVTYFDDIGAKSRVEGIEAMRSYAASLQGLIPAHRYELENPKVQLYGDIAILTFRYSPVGDDQQPVLPWKASVVYRRSNGTWRVVHAHWSTIEET